MRTTEQLSWMLKTCAKGARLALPGVSPTERAAVEADGLCFESDLAGVPVFRRDYHPGYLLGAPSRFGH